jgi:hypothetical protein
MVSILAVAVVMHRPARKFVQEEMQKVAHITSCIYWRLFLWTPVLHLFLLTCLFRVSLRVAEQLFNFAMQLEFVDKTCSVVRCEHSLYHFISLKLVVLGMPE